MIMIDEIMNEVMVKAVKTAKKQDFGETALKEMIAEFKRWQSEVEKKGEMRYILERIFAMIQNETGEYWELSTGYFCEQAEYEIVKKWLEKVLVLNIDKRFQKALDRL